MNMSKQRIHIGHGIVGGMSIFREHLLKKEFEDYLNKVEKGEDVSQFSPNGNWCNNS